MNPPGSMAMRRFHIRGYRCARPPANRFEPSGFGCPSPLFGVGDSQRRSVVAGGADESPLIPQGSQPVAGG